MVSVAGFVVSSSIGAGSPKHSRRRSRTRNRCTCNASQDTEGSNVLAEPELPRPDSICIGRRALLAGIAATATASALTLREEALAAVNFDIDRYGDKELKVSTINSVKQTCRNILQERPDLLPSFFMLGVHDALTYNAQTNEGGPNGSLRFELDRMENSFLSDAVQALMKARQVRRDVSYADTFALAGAVAMEITNGPRIIIQLGRDDATEADPAAGAALYTPSATGEELIAAFQTAGLNGPRDVVLIHGAEGSLTDIAASRVEKLAKEAALSSSDEDDDGGDYIGGGLIDDVTYGKVSSRKRGAVLVSSNVSTLTMGGAKFSNAYLKNLVDANKKGSLEGLSERDRAILSSPATLPFLEQYAKNNGRFRDDCADLFQRMSLLGSSYESLRLQDRI